MESFDSKKATRVWQRVQGGMLPSNHGSIQGLILDRMENSAAYRHLTKTLPQHQALLCSQLYRESKSQTDCLKGMCTLLTGTAGKTPLPNFRTDSVKQLPVKCYGREIRCLAEYERLSADPAYGPVFSCLIHRQREHCTALLELIGILQG
jgi:hypothetical protein